MDIKKRRKDQDRASSRDTNTDTVDVSSDVAYTEEKKRKVDDFIMRGRPKTGSAKISKNGRKYRKAKT